MKSIKDTAFRKCHSLVGLAIPRGCKVESDPADGWW
ncbi:MAG: hypothetical protein IKU71_06190 [Kiritimatiellae bacterium]|nr:hypothetical protein [Kiritimatiellia bacterium]